MNLIPVQVKSPLSIGNKQFRITLSAAWETLLNEYTDRALVLGIRPEHLTLGLPATKNFHGTIAAIEALGNDTYITVKVQDLEQPNLMLQVRVSPEKSVKIGEEVWLSVATDKIHLFDRDTGLVLNVESD
jgi:multiple sugar transport system ATP-binding protein